MGYYRHELPIGDLRAGDTVEYKGKAAYVGDTHRGRYGMRYKLEVNSDKGFEQIWVFESEFVFGTYPIYREHINKHGFPDMLEITANGPSHEVCPQCKSCVMPNRGNGMLCDSCDYEFTLHCQHDYD